MPKITPKSSEIKIKYTVKTREKNNNKNNFKSKEDDDDPIYKLQNIQKYIKGILNEYKDK